MPTWPAGVTTATVTFGKGVTVGGGLTKATLTVEPVFTGTRDIVWAATGDPLLPFRVAFTADDGAAGSVQIPVVDQAGWLDSGQHAYTMWGYRLTQTPYSGRDAGKVRVKYLQPLFGQTVIDFDLIPDGGLGAAVSGPVAAVTSVNGLTGAVTLVGSGIPVPDATNAVKGVLALTGDLAGTAASPTVPGLASKAPLVSPALTGIPTVPTAMPGSNTSQAASTAFVAAAIVALIDGSPAALNTLKELATAIGNDPDFAATVTAALALKAPSASPTFTGIPTVPTAPAGTATGQAASTGFVANGLAGKLDLTVAASTYATKAELAGQTILLLDTDGIPYIAGTIGSGTGTGGGTGGGGTGGGTGTTVDGALTTEAGLILTTETGDPIDVTTGTGSGGSTVGSGSTVDGALSTEAGDVLTTETGDPIDATTGSSGSGSTVDGVLLTETGDYLTTEAGDYLDLTVTAATEVLLTELGDYLTTETGDTLTLDSATAGTVDVILTEASDYLITESGDVLILSSSTDTIDLLLTETGDSLLTEAGDFLTIDSITTGTDVVLTESGDSLALETGDLILT